MLGWRRERSPMTHDDRPLPGRDEPVGCTMCDLTRPIGPGAWSELLPRSPCGKGPSNFADCSMLPCGRHDLSGLVWSSEHG